MDILVIEPFFGGSHAQLINVLLADPLIGSRIKLYTLPAKKWHWRARTSALYFMEAVEPNPNFRILLTSSVLNLAELIALRPDLASLRKIVYFHENQLVYPVRKKQDRDFHYGYCQITTSLAADEVIFNSEFNKESFLQSVSHHLKLMPDHRPKDLQAKIRPKCRVLYFPIAIATTSSTESTKTSCDGKQCHLLCTHGLPVSQDITDAQSASNSRHTATDQSDYLNSNTNTAVQEGYCEEIDRELDKTTFNQSKILHCNDASPPGVKSTSLLHIVWPHRWEHDKDPETFFQALFQLMDEGLNFEVSVLGECYQEIPSIFDVARERLGDRVVAWGFQPKEMYYSILDRAHVVVSTAIHEFFGVSMLEAASRGCFPLCPKRLVYPELYPDECLYSTETQLFKRLKRFCQRPDKILPPQINLEQFSWSYLQEDYRKLLIPSICK